MSGSNQYEPFANTSTDVYPPTGGGSWLTWLAANTQGMTTGIASTTVINTALRQATMIAAAVGQMIANAGYVANDDGNLATLETNLTATLAQAGLGGMGQTLTATGNITAAGGSIITLNAAANDIATLPTPVGNKGQMYLIEVTNAGLSSGPTVNNNYWTIATAAGAFIGSGFNSVSVFYIGVNQSVLVVSDGANWVVLNRGGVGDDQSCYNVTGSRSLGVTYYNTTGRPIFVAVNASSSANSNLSITVGGVAIGGSSQSSAVPGAACFAIVPPGYSYIASMSAGTSSLSDWVELR